MKIKPFLFLVLILTGGRSGFADPADSGTGAGQTNSVPLAKLKAEAEEGDAAAQFELGTVYFKGEYVTQNDVQAVFWFRKAAEQNDPDAQFSLGPCSEPASAASLP